MHQIIGGIVVGALLGPTSGILGKASEKLRPLARKAVKAGLIAERKAKEFAESLRREANQLVAEARTELEEESRSRAE
jgi:polyhydroxyalkanoate synthesis regulator phasin